MQPIIEPVAFTSVWELLTALAFVIASFLLVAGAYYYLSPLYEKVEK